MRLLRTLTGKPITLNLEASDTVARVKAELYLREGLPEALQRLVFAGRQLEDGRPLAEYGLQCGSSVQLALRLCGGGDNATSSSSRASPALAQLQAELAVCRRELAFGRAQLEAAEARSREADAQHQQELIDLRAQVCDLSGRVSAAYTRGSEEGMAAQRSLDAAQSELSEMCSEVLMAEAEAELSEAMLGAGVRGEWREASSITARSEAVQKQVMKIQEERAAVEELVPRLREELRGRAEANEQERLAVEVLEEELRKREKSVSSYEGRARELHRDLQHVLGELRASYEGAQREKRRLEEHVANLERRSTERTRSPRAVAALRAAAHLRGAPRLREPAPTESPGIPWWSSAPPASIRPAQVAEPEREQCEQQESRAASAERRRRAAVRDVVEQPDAEPHAMPVRPARAAPYVEDPWPADGGRLESSTAEDSGLFLDAPHTDFFNEASDVLSPLKQVAEPASANPAGSRGGRPSLARQGSRQGFKSGGRRRLPKRSSVSAESENSSAFDACGSCGAARVSDSSFCQQCGEPRAASVVEDQGDAASDSSGYWQNYDISEEALSRQESPREVGAPPT